MHPHVVVLCVASCFKVDFVRAGNKEAVLIGGGGEVFVVLSWRFRSGDLFLILNIEKN